MRQCRLFIIIFTVFSINSYLYAQDINLGEYQAFARQGFSFDWAFSSPLVNDEAWTKIAPSSSGTLNISMPGLGLVKARTLKDYSAFTSTIEKLTIAIPFQVTEYQLRFRTGAGIFIGSIGQNWQVYLNGRLIRDENFILSDGSIKTERSKRSVLVALDQGFLRKGENLLCIMISGSPYSSTTGLKGELIIGDYSTLNAKRNEVLRLILVGIYAFFALYHIILFAFNRTNKAYLFYTISSGLLSLFLLANTNLAYDSIINTRLVGDTGRISYFFIAVSLMAFYDVSINGKVSPFTRSYAIIAALASVLSLARGGELLVSIWHFTLFAPFFHAIYSGLILPVYQKRKKINAADSFIKNNIAFILVLLISSIALWFKAPALGMDLPWPDFTFLALAFGSAVSLAGQVVSAYRQGEQLGAVLTEHVESRTKELTMVMSEAESISARLNDTRANLSVRVEEAAQDMRLATRVQRGFFPENAPVTAFWDSAVAFFPASGISGDFYDFYTRGKNFDGLLLGDVSGHGIASGLVTLLSRSIFYRNFYELKSRSLGAMLETINTELISELSGVDNFITAALLRLNDDGRVEYTSAAHTDLLYLGADQTKAASLKPKGITDYKGPPLGREGIESPYSSVRFKLKGGDIILAYTDGFDEAKNVEGQEFGIKGMLDALSSAPKGDAQQMLDFIVREWRFHVSGTTVSDDASAILLKKLS